MRGLGRGLLIDLDSRHLDSRPDSGFGLGEQEVWKLARGYEGPRDVAGHFDAVGECAWLVADLNLELVARCSSLTLYSITTLPVDDNVFRTNLK